MCTKHVCREAEARCALSTRPNTSAAHRGASLGERCSWPSDTAQELTPEGKRNSTALAEGHHLGAGDGAALIRVEVLEVGRNLPGVNCVCKMKRVFPGTRVSSKKQDAPAGPRP